jgi:hypothetical protein
MGGAAGAAFERSPIMTRQHQPLSTRIRRLRPSAASLAAAAALHDPGPLLQLQAQSRRGV